MVSRGLLRGGESLKPDPATRMSPPPAMDTLIPLKVSVPSRPTPRKVDYVAPYAGKAKADKGISEMPVFFVALETYR